MACNSLHFKDVTHLQYDSCISVKTQLFLNRHTENSTYLHLKNKLKYIFILCMVMHRTVIALAHRILRNETHCIIGSRHCCCWSLVCAAMLASLYLTLFNCLYLCLGVRKPLVLILCVLTSAPSPSLSLCQRTAVVSSSILKDAAVEDECWENMSLQW